MSSDSPSRHVRIRFWVKCALHDYLGSRLPYRIPDPPRPMMLGYRGPQPASQKFRRHDTRAPLVGREASAQVCLGSLWALKRNIVLECRLEIHADAIDLAAPHD